MREFVRKTISNDNPSSKWTIKMRKVTTLAVLAAALLSATGAYAQSDIGTVSTQVETLRFSSTDAAVPSLDVTGLRFTIDGAYASGFNYQLDSFSRDMEGVNWSLATAEIGYTFEGIGGPVAVYEYQRIAGFSETRGLVGLQGGLDQGDLRYTGRALIDVTNSSTYELGLGASWNATPDLTVTGDYTYFLNGDAANISSYELGGKYRIKGNLSGLFGVEYQRANGAGDRLYGANVGLSFSF